MAATFDNPTNDSSKCRVGAFEIDCVSREELVDWCERDISGHVLHPKLVMDVNGHALSLARTDKTFRDLVTQADIIHADGGFIVSISQRMCRAAIPERSATTDMIHDFAERFAKNGHSFYLLGATEEVNRVCARKLETQYPGLRIVGRRNGYFTEQDEAAIVDEINSLKPDVIWLGLGKPKEQDVAVRWKHLLSGPSWLITCGGCFNYITGHYPRAPQWFQRNNVEWLHRLATNPRKLFWRYLITTPHALWLALTDHD